MKNNADFFIQQEELASKKRLMLSLNLNQAFPDATVNAKNKLLRPKIKLSGVILIVYHSITEVLLKRSSENAKNVSKHSRTTSGANGSPTKLIRVITESNNNVRAAQKHGV